MFVVVRLIASRPAPDPYAAEALQRSQATTPQEARDAIRFPWPRYPGAREQGRSQITLNQVPMVEQTLLARGRPESILSFYRRAMRGRGWRDNTEQFYHLERSVLAGADSIRNLQDENYLRRYDAVTRSKLSLVRKKESILIEVSPGEKGKNVIELHFAGTSSLADMVMDMAEKAERAQGRPIAFLSAQGLPGDDATSSRMFYSEKGQEGTFRDMVRMLESEGWTRASLPRGARPPARGSIHQAFFARGSEVALLAVRPAGEHGSAAMVTESSAAP